VALERHMFAPNHVSRYKVCERGGAVVAGWWRGGGGAVAGRWRGGGGVVAGMLGAVPRGAANVDLMSFRVAAHGEEVLRAV
jgi:hypothetical protein